MRDWTRLVRVPNLLLAAAGVIAGGWIAAGMPIATRALLLAAVSGAALGAAGNAVNDLNDLAADRINHPARPLVRGSLSRGTALATVAIAAIIGLGAAAAASGAQLGSGAAALAVMIAYSPLLKRHGWPGNVAVAAIAGLPLWYGALAAGRPGAGAVPWIIGGWLHLAREVVKDVEDVAGDQAAGRRTIAVRHGVATALRVARGLIVTFVALALVLPFAAGFGWAYYVVAVPAFALVGAAARRLAQGGIVGVSGVLKAAMAVGVVALVAGGLT